MSRLLWQTWRESRLTMFLTAIFASTLGLFGILILVNAVPGLRGSIGGTPFVEFIVFCMLGAIYGSQVFAADHRGGRYRFLGEHAADPRFVWLSRHVVWITSLLAMLGLAACVIAPFTLTEWSKLLDSLKREMIHFNRWSYHWTRFVDDYGSVPYLIIQSAIGLLSGYAVGQLASLFVPRSISAGFLAIVLPAFISIWGVLTIIWQLPMLFFLLLPILGLLLATWLYIPDWITSRRSKWSWTKAIASIAIPIAIVTAAVPFVRMNQVGQLKLGTYDWLAGSGPIDSSLVFSPNPEAEELIGLAESIERVSAKSDDGEEVPAEQRVLDWQRRYVEKNHDILQRAAELANEAEITFPI